MSKPASFSKTAAALKAEIQPDADGRSISLGPAFEARLALRLRREEADQAIARVAVSAGAECREQEMTVVLRAPSSPAASALRDQLATTLADLADRPLTPRLVTEALGISNQERLRWTKDGRLPTSGRAQIKGAALVTFATYAVSVIEALAADPTVVHSWRAGDRMRLQRGSAATS